MNSKYFNRANSDDTTVTLSNAVSIESIGKMPGHKNKRTSWYYAKILDNNVSEDMISLKQKFIDKIV